MEKVCWDEFKIYEPRSNESLEEGTNPLNQFIYWINGSYGLSITEENEVERYDRKDLNKDDIKEILGQNIDHESSDSVSLSYCMRPDKVLMYDITHETSTGTKIRLHGNQKLEKEIDNCINQQREDKNHYLPEILQTISDNQ
jgi:hypothetical protein